MHIDLLGVRLALLRLLVREDGQDLVEYALVVALIALGCTAGMNAVATAINTAFSHVGSTITTNI